MQLKMPHTALLSFLLTLAGCVASNETAVFERAAADEMARHPAWYSNGEARSFLVSRGGQARALLWGTLHIGYGESTMLPRPIRDRFAEASDLTVEFPLNHMPPTDRRLLNEALQQAIRTHDPAALARLDAATRAALDSADLPSGSVDRFSLMGLSRLVTARALAEPANSLPRMGFVDLTLMGFADNRHIPVFGLESPEVQIALMFLDPNGPDAATELRQSLRRRQDIKSFMLWVKGNYEQGRVAEVLAGLQGWQADADDLARAERQRNATLTKRNAAWLPKLETTLAEPGFHFAAFGAGHLLGEDGVVNLLRRDGWSVSPCPGDSCPAMPVEN